VVVLAVGADEGYGPTWDSDDEYDNFIRKMNPPRCAPQLFTCRRLSPLLSRHKNRSPQCNITGDEKSRVPCLIPVNFGDCRIVIDNESSAEATIVRVHSSGSLNRLDPISAVSKINVLICSPCHYDCRWIVQTNMGYC
jgi:hypothetical protein